ncbi:MAG: TonB C-terminal domain-containing protein [Proteobacteria bacterium]|nr:TonB C-terminal domain-containing protein [Pseudomonadota bacterium]
MLKARVKFLASVYTAILMVIIGSLLVFGGFNITPEMVKGTTIQATMIDISQIKPRKKSTTQNQTIEPREEVSEEVPETKPEEKSEEKPEIKPIKEDPPIIKTPIPKIDTKAQEIERKKTQEREKKREEIRKKKLAVEKRKKQAQQDLKDLANKIKQENDSPPTENIGSISGTVEANERNQLIARYQLAVISSVEKQWNKPASANKNLLCHVKVKQIPGGGVVTATISTPCNANSIVRKSIIAAILKADPLPYKGFESVFVRSATFIFQPSD